MSGLFATIAISAILILLAVAGLAIGLILTGKPKIVRGACGRIPNARRDEHCGKEIKCGLCDRGEKG